MASVGPLEQAPVAWKVRISASQARTVRQAGQLRDLDAVCPAVEAIQGGAGYRRASRGVDRSQQLLALPGGSDLTSGISRGQAGP
jgi:hypothetical protein